MGYVAYNKMYYNGRATGRRYRITGNPKSTASAARAEAIKENLRWNRWVSKQKGRNRYMRAKLVEVKKV